MRHATIALGLLAAAHFGCAAAPDAAEGSPIVCHGTTTDEVTQSKASLVVLEATPKGVPVIFILAEAVQGERPRHLITSQYVAAGSRETLTFRIKTYTVQARPSDDAGWGDPDLFRLKFVN